LRRPWGGAPGREMLSDDGSGEAKESNPVQVPSDVPRPLWARSRAQDGSDTPSSPEKIRHGLSSEDVDAELPIEMQSAAITPTSTYPRGSSSSSVPEVSSPDRAAASEQAEEIPVMYDMTEGDSSISPERHRDPTSDDWLCDDLSALLRTPVSSTRAESIRSGTAASSVAFPSSIGSPVISRSSWSARLTASPGPVSEPVAPTRGALARCRSVPAQRRRPEELDVVYTDEQPWWWNAGRTSAAALEELMQCSNLQEFVESHGQLRADCQRLRESQVMCFEAIKQVGQVVMSEQLARQTESEDRKRLQEELQLMRSMMQSMLQFQQGQAALPRTSASSGSVDESPAVQARLDELERDHKELRQLLAETRQATISASEPQGQQSARPAGAATVAAATGMGEQRWSRAELKSRRAARSPSRRRRAEAGRFEQAEASLAVGPKKKKSSKGSKAEPESYSYISSFF